MFSIIKMSMNDITMDGSFEMKKKGDRIVKYM